MVLHVGDIGILSMLHLQDSIQFQMCVPSSEVCANVFAAYANGDIAIWDTFMAEVEPYAAAVPYMIGIGNHEVCT